MKAGLIVATGKDNPWSVDVLATPLFAGWVTRCLDLKVTVFFYVKGKGKGLDTCYIATYMSQTRDQQRFTIS